MGIASSSSRLRSEFPKSWEKMRFQFSRVFREFSSYRPGVNVANLRFVELHADTRLANDVDFLIEPD